MTRYEVGFDNTITSERPWYLKVDGLFFQYYKHSEYAKAERDLLIKTDEVLTKIRDFIDMEFEQLAERQKRYIIEHTMGKIDLNDFILEAMMIDLCLKLDGWII